MTDLKELQEALDNLPIMEKRIPTLTDFIRYYGKLDEWTEDFNRKFTTYRAEQEKKDKQLSDLMKRQPLPESFRWITDFKSQYVHWTKKLKKLLEK